MYAGEVNVSQEQLPAFLKTAARLKVGFTLQTLLLKSCYSSVFQLLCKSDILILDKYEIGASKCNGCRFKSALKFSYI